MASEDVLERAETFMLSQEPWGALKALRVIDALEAEVRELRKDKAMAFRLMRSRDDRLSAIRDCVRQNKGDDLVRVEVEYLLDCPYSELDAKKERNDGVS